MCRPGSHICRQRLLNIGDASKLNRRPADGWAQILNACSEAVISLIMCRQLRSFTASGYSGAPL